MHMLMRSVLAMATALAVLCAGIASAAPPKDPNKAKANPREFHAKKLIAAREAMEAEDWKLAEESLEDVLKRRPNVYEEAMVHQFRGYIAIARDDAPAALEQFQKALDTDGLAYSANLDLMFRIGALNLSMEKFREAAEILERWFAEVSHPDSPKKPNESNYRYLALAYYQLEETDKALKPALKARSLGKPAPAQSTLELLVALYHIKGDYKRIGVLLKELIDLYPKKGYFLQLSGVLSQLERNKDAVAIQQLAHHHGWLDNEGEYRTLAQMLLANEMPYPAVKVMLEGFEKEILQESVENYQLLADAWLVSRDVKESFEPLKKAAAMSTDGKIYLRLGQAYVEGESWKPAEEALLSALEKGGLEAEGTAHLLLGVSRYNQERLGPARTSFRRATNYEDTQVAAARWVDYIDKKLARERAQREANQPKKEEPAEGEAEAQKASAEGAEAPADAAGAADAGATEGGDAESATDSAEAAPETAAPSADAA